MVGRSASSPFTRSARAYYQLSVVLYSLFHAKYVRVFGLGRVWECDESIVSSTAPLSACSRSLFLFPCENQPQLYQFLLFFQYLGTVLLVLTMIAHKQNIYFTRRLIIRLSIFFNNEMCLSEEQVPSAPVELLNGKPKKASFTLGVKNTWYPVE